MAPGLLGRSAGHPGTGQGATVAWSCGNGAPPGIRVLRPTGAPGTGEPGPVRGASSAGGAQGSNAGADLRPACRARPRAPGPGVPGIPGPRPRAHPAPLPCRRPAWPPAPWRRAEAFPAAARPRTCVSPPSVVPAVMLRPGPDTRDPRPTMIPEPPISRSPASARTGCRGAAPGEDPLTDHRDAPAVRDLHAFIAGLPKAELHVHHVGSASPRIVSELAARHPDSKVPTDPRPSSTTSRSRTSPTSSRSICPWSTSSGPPRTYAC